MDNAFKKIATMNLDSNLKDIQDGSIASIQMLSKTFCGILIAFQQQINQEKEHEEKLNDIYNKIQNIDDNITQANESIKGAVNDINDKLQKQENATNDKLHKIETNLLNVTDNVQKECKDLMQTVSKKLNAASKNVDNVETELNKYAVQMESMQTKVEDTLDAVNDKQDNIEERLNETQQMINDKVSDIQQEIAKDKKDSTQKLGDVKEKFENLRFEVDQLSAKKADIEDMKRKTDLTDFNELTDTVTNVTDTFSTNIDAMQNTMDANQDKMEKDMEENKEITQKKLSNVDEEINRINNSLGQLQFKFNEKNDDENNDMLSMIHQLQRNMDEVTVAMVSGGNGNNNNKPGINDVMGATNSGSCFSCGQQINSSFPPLPTRHRSPDKKHIGGGFTLNNDKNTKFNEKMRNELSHLANELSSPTKSKSTSKFNTLERKPVKLPSLNKSNTTPQL